MVLFENQVAQQQRYNKYPDTVNIKYPATFFFLLSLLGIMVLLNVTAYNPTTFPPRSRTLMRSHRQSTPGCSGSARHRVSTRRHPRDDPRDGSRRGCPCRRRRGMPALTRHEEIGRVGHVGQGCYEDASDLSATSRECRAHGIWRTTLYKRCSL